MITGHNTDVEYDGVVYHVQTEDKGLETPLVLSLVYSGGAILASKRSSYHDLIAAGFDESVLIERLNRQHRLICAAIHAGRLADLKKLGPPPRTVAQVSPPTAEPEPVEQRQPVAPAPEPERIYETAQSRIAEEPKNPEVIVEQPVPAEIPLAPVVPRRRSQASPYTVYDSRRSSPLGEIPEVEEGLRINLTGEKNYRGGDEVELRVTVTRVTSEAESPLSAAVSVKILGTSFRPVILSLKTDRQGTVAVSTSIPSFKSGRAAIVIKATAADLTTETRRVIHPG
jgi:hypothetical protein